MYKVLNLATGECFQDVSMCTGATGACEEPSRLCSTPYRRDAIYLTKELAVSEIEREIRRSDMVLATFARYPVNKTYHQRYNPGFDEVKLIPEQFEIIEVDGD